MKRFSKLLLVLISIFAFIPFVNAESSKYETIVSIDGEVKDGEFYVILGYDGEEISDLNVKLGYDKNYLELTKVIPLNDYIYEDKEEDIHDEWKVKNITVTKSELSLENNYCMVMFKINDKLKVGSSTDVFLYDQVAKGLEEYNYKDNAKLLVVRRAEDKEITILVQDVTKRIEIEYWVKKNILLFALIGIIVVVLIIVILIIPSRRKKEHRSKKIRTTKATASKKNTYTIDHGQANNEYKVEIDPFNGNGAKMDVMPGQQLQGNQMMGQSTPAFQQNQMMGQNAPVSQQAPMMNQQPGVNNSPFIQEGESVNRNIEELGVINPADFSDFNK